MEVGSKVDMILTPGAVARISKGEWPVPEGLLLQVFKLLVIEIKKGEKCYGALLSDGVHFKLATLPPLADVHVRSGMIRRGTVVCLKQYWQAALGIRVVIVITGMEVVKPCCEMIGKPNAYIHFSIHSQNKLAKLCAGSNRCYVGVGLTPKDLNWHLTRGVIAMFQRPVMQVVGISQLTLKLKGSGNVCHLILSDGVHTLNASLSSFQNHLVKDAHIRKGTIVCLLTFRYYTIHSLSTIRIANLEVLQTECELIGSPKAYELHCIEKLDRLNKSKCGEPYSELVTSYVQPNNESYFNFRWYLTHGAVAAIMNGEMEVEQQPVMQVVDFSLMSQNGFSFYRILLSDGIHQVYANLFPHLSHLVADNDIQKGTRVRLLKFIRDSFKQDKNYRITIAVELEVLDKECEPIGSPIFYELGNKEKELDAGHAASVPLAHLVQSVGGPHIVGQGLKCHLTRGIVAVLEQPIMQVVTVYSTRSSELKKYAMYSLILSDGVHKHDVILASKLNHLVENTHLGTGTIIRLLYVGCSLVESSSGFLVAVVDLQILQTEFELIGSPKEYEPCNMEKKHAPKRKLHVDSYAQPHLNGQSFKGHLTQGAVAAMVEGEITVEQQQPVMQMVSFSWFFSSIELSDGVYKVYGILSPHLTHLVKDNRLRDGTIIRVLKAGLMDWNIIINELEVLQTIHEPIGCPTFYVCRDARNEQMCQDARNEQFEWADLAAFLPEDDAAQATGGSRPRKKARDVRNEQFEWADLAAFLPEGDTAQPTGGSRPRKKARDVQNEQFEWADLAAFLPEGDAAQPTGGSRPRKKATGDVRNEPLFEWADLAAFLPEGNAAQPTGGSHPTKKATQEVQNERVFEWADLAALLPQGDAAQPTGGSRPRYKATPG